VYRRNHAVVAVQGLTLPLSSRLKAENWTWESHQGGPTKGEISMIERACGNEAASTDHRKNGSKV
jgi:hypothetical protein